MDLIAGVREDWRDAFCFLCAGAPPPLDAERDRAVLDGLFVELRAVVGLPQDQLGPRLRAYATRLRGASKSVTDYRVFKRILWVSVWAQEDVVVIEEEED